MSSILPSNKQPSFGQSLASHLTEALPQMGKSIADMIEKRKQDKGYAKLLGLSESEGRLFSSLSPTVQSAYIKSKTPPNAAPSQRIFADLVKKEMGSSPAGQEKERAKFMMTEGGKLMQQGADPVQAYGGASEKFTQREKAVDLLEKKLTFPESHWYEPKTWGNEDSKNIALAQKNNAMIINSIRATGALNDDEIAETLKKNNEHFDYNHAHALGLNISPQTMIKLDLFPSKEEEGAEGEGQQQQQQSAPPTPEKKPIAASVTTQPSTPAKRPGGGKRSKAPTLDDVDEYMERAEGDPARAKELMEDDDFDVSGLE